MMRARLQKTSAYAAGRIIGSLPFRSQATKGLTAQEQQERREALRRHAAVESVKAALGTAWVLHRDHGMEVSA